MIEPEPTLPSSRLEAVGYDDVVADIEGKPTFAPDGELDRYPSFCVEYRRANSLLRDACSCNKAIVQDLRAPPTIFLYLAIVGLEPRIYRRLVPSESYFELEQLGKNLFNTLNFQFIKYCHKKSDL